MEQILRFVLLSITTELFKGEKKADSSWRERCRLPACGVNSLFLTLTRHISASFCPLTLVIPLAGKHWTTTYWSKNQNCIYSCPHACNTDCVWRSGSLKKHDSRPVSKFVVSMKHSARPGSKKNSLWSTEAQKRACWRSDQSRRRAWVRQRIFQSFVYMCMPVTRDAIIVQNQFDVITCKPYLCSSGDKIGLKRPRLTCLDGKNIYLALLLLEVVEFAKHHPSLPSRPE